MGRIPEDELERIKREADLAALVRARGVELKPHGHDLMGLCPFHDDHEPSLIVTPGKNLWHCLGACSTGGSAIDWVMKAEGVSFRHAVEILRAGGPPPSFGAPPVKTSAVRVLPPPVTVSAADHELLLQVLEYYHQTLLTAPEAMDYLARRRIGAAEAIRTFKLGFANRTLGLRLPQKHREDGVRMRGRLAALGLLRDSGHEHFNGCLVIPVFDAAGRAVEVYGRKIVHHQARGLPSHLYLPGPHRGVFNLAALRTSPEIILCEALIDALTFWCAGFRHVTAAYGVNGFTADHLEAFKAHGTERVLIAYDRDEAGDKAAAELASKLAPEGIACFRVRFPHGMDANDYACTVTPASQSLAVLLRAAEYLAGPLAAHQARAQPPGLEAQAHPPAHDAAPAPTQLPAPSLAAVSAVPAGHPLPVPTERPPDRPATRPTGPPAAPPAAPLTAWPLDPPGATPAVTPAPRPPHPAPPPLASPVPAGPRPDIPAEITASEVVIRLGDRRYRVRGLATNTAYDVLKVNLMVTAGEPLHVDTLNLYSARQRTIFAGQAAAELGVKEEVIAHDLGKVLLKLEALQDELIKQALAPRATTVTIPDHEQAEALAFLRDPHLLDRISADFATCGLVGERTNTLVAYLATVSRKLERPLAVMVQSSSAAGKSALMDAALAFVPPEERVAYSAMTGQSLFYMGEVDLKHKVLAIAEEEGAERASYALKLLQSEGELSIASTGKDPATGRLVTHEYHVEGPSAILLTTTAIDLDEELLNRCIVLAVDESREQTRAIHDLQRRSRTREGAVTRRKKPHILTVHRNAQRLLRPLAVRNHYAGQLTFLDDATRTRRDHEKYLTLIDAIALLHQHQREVKTDLVDGEREAYIEVTLDDLAAANHLAHDVLGRTLDALPPQTRRLLVLIEAMVKADCERQKLERRDYRLTRRQIRERTGWGLTQLRLHLDRLVDMEYLLVHKGGRGQSFVYELLYAGEGQDGHPFVLGLLDVETLRAKITRQSYDPNLAGSAPHLAGEDGHLAGSKRGHGGGMAPGWRSAERPAEPDASPGIGPSTLDTAPLGTTPPAASYPPETHRNPALLSLAATAAPSSSPSPSPSLCSYQPPTTINRFGGR